MQTVVGLFQSDEDAQSATDRLKEAGLTDDEISLLSDYDSVQKLFGSYEVFRVMKYVIWGAVIGVTILLLYGLVLGGYACTTLFGYIPLSYLACDVVGSIVIGLILGATAGWFIGVNSFEKEVDQYTHGVCRDRKLMSVKVGDDLISKVSRILRQEHAEAVKRFADLQAKNGKA
jgi:hypothetical protein